MVRRKERWPLEGLLVLATLAACGDDEGRPDGRVDAGRVDAGQADAGQADAGQADACPAERRRTWYLDSDGDHFGDREVLTEACDQPDGYVTNGDDCNDDDAAVYQLMNYQFRDEDGDGYTVASAGRVCTSDRLPPGYLNQGNSDDCRDDDPEFFRLWRLFPDQDRDGLGAEEMTLTCGGDEAPLGYTEKSGDCDDNDAGIVHPDNFDAVGGGTAADPYVVCNARQFASLGELESRLASDENIDAHFRLVADIDLQTAYDAGIGEFTIGRYGYTRGPSYGAFVGGFDAGGHTIANFRHSSNGLFAQIGCGAVVSDLVLKNVEISGRTYPSTSKFGALADNVRCDPVEGSVAPVLDNIQIENVSITVRSRASQLGGAIGRAGGSAEISRVHVSGHIELSLYRVISTRVGGFIGEAEASGRRSGQIRIEQSSSHVSINIGKNTNVEPGLWSVGGFVGTSVSTSIANCYARGRIWSTNATTGRAVGGFVGDMQGGEITSSYSSGAVFGVSDVAGFAGDFEHGKISNSFSVSESIYADSGARGFFAAKVGRPANFENNYHWSAAPCGCSGANSTGISDLEVFYSIRGDEAFLPTWDFDQIWQDNSASGALPTLRSEN